MAQQAVSSVLERIGSSAVDEAKYLWGVSDKLESAQQQLRRMQAFLSDLDDKMLRGGAMARNLVSEVRAVTYMLEDIIDTANIMKRQRDSKISTIGAISKCVGFPIYLTHLHKLGARIDSANARMKTIFEDFEKYNVVATAITEAPRGYIVEDDTIQNWRSVHPEFDTQVDVIGFDDQIKQIKIDLLDEENKHLTVVSIVGPGGAGKSTMAKKVYGLAEVKGHFEHRAWITVSQRYVPRDIFKEMIRRLVPHHLLKEMIQHTMGVDSSEKAKELEELTEQEFKKLLHDFALRERYLLVLDDVWSTSAWDLISTAIPDGKNGSRVVLTTRNEVVAQQPNARKKIYKPKLLNEKESIDLLLSTALPEYILDGTSNSPAAKAQNLNEFKELGKELAVKCQGLPLAIVVLGGYLSRNLDVSDWKRLTGSKEWQAMITTDRVIGSVLDLSYYDMPSHMRSCFLYTTTFPEDSIIYIRDLTSLWIAEGFIPLVRGYTHQELAVKFVAELVQRCMVQVEKLTISGRIKVIKVHDILRDWGIGRARREGFVKDGYSVEDIETAYSDETIEAYRVALHAKLTGEVAANKRQIRTLLNFYYVSGIQMPQPELLMNFVQSLRVLYICNLGSTVHLPKVIGRMRYLRYLGLGGRGSRYHLPSSIGGLISLETFHATGGIDHIPDSLFKIPTLRHVYARHARSWSVPRISSTSRLQVMVSKVKSGYFSTNDIMEMDATQRQIQMNKSPSHTCCFVMISKPFDEVYIAGRCKEGSLSLCDLSDFKRWQWLQRLKICCTNLLRNDQEILELGRMKQLKKLEIIERSYTGSVMTYPSGSFPKLTHLVLHDLAVDSLKLERGSMPKLMILVLCKCPNLIDLPEGLSWLSNLIKLDLIAMPPGCQQGTVARALEEMDCMVFASPNMKDFQGLGSWN